MAKKVSAASRIEVLRERVATAQKNAASTFDVPFRGKSISLSKIRVETDFPMFRIQSGRTHRAQCQYLEEHPELPSDFFKDPEDPKVQKAQYAILLRMISEMDLDTDLKERGQLAPLVLTKDGYVVDGNRRLAALRQRGEQYAEAVVLPPDAESREIFETELEFQMRRETKAPYNWIDQALHIEYGINELHERVPALAKRMRMSDPEITRELEKLNLVRQYLAWLGAEDQYHKVPAAGGGHMEQAFIEMATKLSTPAVKRKSEKEKRLIREACYAAIKKESGYQDIRNIIKQFSQNASRIAARLRERRPVSSKASSPKPTKPARASTAARVEADDPLRQLARISSPSSNMDVDELAHAMGDSDSASEILSIVGDLEAEDKEAKKQQLPLQRIQHAINDLQQVELLNSSDDYAGIAKALASLSKEIERLSRVLEKAQARK